MALFDSDDPFLAHESDRYRNRENHGRRAGVYANFDTTGYGAIEFEKRIDFGLIYIHEPWVSYGSRLELDDLRDALNLDDDAKVPSLPLTSGFVTDFDTDKAGNYIGAWVAVNVQYPATIPTSALVKMRHYFSFEGVALKDVPF